MQYTNLIWRDGQPYSEQFDDIYYSSDESEDIPGENEFQHVFFKHNGLPERWQGRDDFVIAELGFGSGLNCLLTIREWLKHCDASESKNTLHYIAIEKYPLSPAAIVELLCRYPALKPYCDELLDNYPPAVEASHSRRLFAGRVVIHFKFMDVTAALENDSLNVDTWFLDGFAPAKNPDMWSLALFQNIANNSHALATCSTYTAAGFVKRNLQQAGFIVNKVSGYGKKREMLVAKREAEKTQDEKRRRFKDKPWFELPARKTVSAKKATIIGAGIAGLSLAYALVQRGWKITIIDKHGSEQKEASSNPAPIVYPRLSINNDVDTEFFITAYCHALHQFESLHKKSGKSFWFGGGLLQQIDKKRISRIIDKFHLNKDFISIVNDGEPAGQVIAEYHSAGVLLPAVLCDVLKQACGDKLDIIDAKITSVNRKEKSWQCFQHAQLIRETERLIIANGTEINRLGLPFEFPVEAIRGQVVTLRETKASQQIKKTLNADVHITPAINGKHYLGATYAKDCLRRDVCPAEDRKLLDALAELYPGVFKDSDHCASWVGFRTVAKDRVPVVGAVPDAVFFNAAYADMRHGNTNKSYPPASHLEGLYISVAHGSRGFTTTFLSAEIIAAQLSGEPSPVNKQVLDYLSPSRFIVNNLKRG